MAKDPKLKDEYITSQLPEPEKAWTLKIRELLQGKKCLGGRYLTQEEADEMGWSKRPFCMFFEGGLIVYASSDDEGNDGGSLFTTDEDLSVIPVL